MMEGDIVVRQGDLGGSSALDAPLANPDRLWPSGMVEYKYYDTFPAQNRKIMQNAMEYITRKVSCINFREATELTKDYVLIRDAAGVCRSELGRIGGMQEIELNRFCQNHKNDLYPKLSCFSGCFDLGLMTPVHELLHPRLRARAYAAGQGQLHLRQHRQHQGRQGGKLREEDARIQ